MTPGEKILLERWQRRAANLTPDLIRGILVTYDRIRGLLSPSELARAFEDGTLFDLIDAVLSDNTQDPALAELRALLGETGLESARQAARDLPRRVATTFGVLNPRVLEAARTVTDRVLATVRAEVRETVRETMVAGIEAGKGPRVIANRIIQNVGLPPQYARAVENFRAQLEAGDRKALSRALARGSLQRPDGSRLANRFHAGSEGLTQIQLQRLEKTLGSKPLTPQQIDTLVNSYSKRLHAWHAETLARTAALDAQRAGQRAVWEDAIDRGMVPRERLFKRWRTVGDSRVRDEHRALNGTEVHFDAAFPNGEVTPGERSWNCRCQAMYFLKRAEREALEELRAVPPTPPLETPVGAEFVPAGSIREAEEWAVNNLGVKVADYSKMDLATANMTNRRLSELMAEYQGKPFELETIAPLKEVYRQQRRTFRRGTDERLVYEVHHSVGITGKGVTGEMRMSLGYSVANTTSAERLQGVMSKLDDSGLIRGMTDITEPLTHEFGHMIDNANAAGWSTPGQRFYESFRQWYSDSSRGSGGRLSRITNEFGSYLDSNPAEFFAEMFRLYKHGKLPAELDFIASMFKDMGV